MTQPLIVDLPHSLGAEEAKRRIAGGVGRLQNHIPGGAKVDSRWEADRMLLSVHAMGQSIDGHIDILEKTVRLEIQLPAFLALFGNKIAGLLRSQGAELLEDKSKP
jgi:hypothetical protein